MKEEWKRIDGYPGYWISSYGRIYSERSERFLRPGKRSEHSRQKSSYYQVNLFKNGERTVYPVHRLVAENFIPNPNNYPVVRHLDNNPWNNRVDDNGRETSRNKIRKPVVLTDKRTGEIKTFEQLQDVCDEIGICQATAWKLLKRFPNWNGNYPYRIDYLLMGDKNMEHINHFPEYHMELEWEDLPDGGRKKIVHNWFRGVDLGTGGYIVGNPGVYENVVMLDVSSMHPSSIIALNLFGNEYTQRFKELVDARIAIKHGDYDKAKTLLNGELAPFLDDPSQAKALANALKLAINSVYGMTYQDYEGNPFHDKRNVNNIVALRGAIFMKMLQDEMEGRGVKVVAIRTDSIKLLSPSPEDIDFAMEFAKKYSYSFEFECVYDRICLTTKSDYVAKYMTAEKCKELYGWVPEENEKMGGQWTSTAAFFSRPYVFKKLFSHDEITFKDICETKERRAGSMYLDMNEGLPEGEHNYVFVGRVGLFCPIAPGRGGGELMAKIENKNGTISYNAVTGTKGYRWLEAEQVKFMSKEDDIDMSYFHNLADEAIAAINQYSDFEWFTRD